MHYERRREILSRFLKYADKQYGVRETLQEVTDKRSCPDIPTKRIVTALFLMVAARIGSLNGIENALGGKHAPGKQWRNWMGGALPSADRLGEVAALLNLDDLRAAIIEHHRRRKRKKTLPALPGGLRVLIFDGHEMWTSYRQRCEGALSRQLQCKDEVRTQYYQRYVAAYLLGAKGRVLLDMEMQQPGEGEIAAAERLYRRMLANCPRAFNVVAGDALYLDPHLCQLILDSGKDFVAVLKNENRILIQDFREVLELNDEPPLQFEYNGKQCHCHDIEGFTTWPQLEPAVRIVRSLETCSVRRQLTKEEEELSSEWLWATSLSKDNANTHTVVRIGHGRWSIENQGFNELVHEWHADHVYHLNTNAISAILLLLFLAYNIFHVWLERGLKPVLRQEHTGKYFSRQIQAEFYAVLLSPG